MADGTPPEEDLETELLQLQHRMYQVEDVLRSLQDELCELKEQAAGEPIAEFTEGSSPDQVSSRQC